jgi:hypothetical protein
MLVVVDCSKNEDVTDLAVGAFLNIRMTIK